MNVRRGDVCLARFRHAAGGRGKKRPVVVVQADAYNPTRRHVIVAEVTTNLGAASDPANLFIAIATPDGQATGLMRDSLVTCLHLVTMTEDRIGKLVGKLPLWSSPATRRLPEGRTWSVLKSAPSRNGTLDLLP